MKKCNRIGLLSLEIPDATSSRIGPIGDLQRIPTPILYSVGLLNCLSYELPKSEKIAARQPSLN